MKTKTKKMRSAELTTSKRAANSAKTAKTALAALTKRVGATTAVAALTRRVGELQLPARMTRARRAMAGLGTQGVRKLKKHPVGAVVGAFATGVVVTKLASRG